MSKAIAINQQQIALKTYEGKAVVTFSDIDAVHQRPEGTARRNFNGNKTRFVEGEDYFKVCANEIRTRKIMEIPDKATSDVTLITESGYLMLCKSFTDDLSWKVQRQLVDCYFRRNEADAEPAPYEYYDKTYQGVPVLTTMDFEHFTGISKSAVNWCLRHHGTLGKDYMQAVSFEERCRFKKENPRFRQSFNALNLITRSGVELLCAAFAIQFEPPKSLVKAPKRQPVLPEAPKPTPKQRPMVLDVPGSYECTRLVNEAKRYAVTVQTMLDRYIMYRSAEDLKGYRESLELITSDLCSKVCDLRQVKIKEIESPAF